MNTEKNRQALGIIMTLNRCVILGIVRKLWPVLFQYKEVTSDWLVPIRLTGAGALILLLLFIKDRENVFAMWREARGRRDILIFARHWHDALSIRIFHNDPVFQTQEQHGAAVHRTGHDPCVSVYSEPQKTEIYEVVALFCSMFGTLFWQPMEIRQNWQFCHRHCSGEWWRR